jgi:hypothetical protein
MLVISILFVSNQQEASHCFPVAELTRSGGGAAVAVVGILKSDPQS